MVRFPLGTINPRYIMTPNPKGHAQDKGDPFFWPLSNENIVPVPPRNIPMVTTAKNNVMYPLSENIRVRIVHASTSMSNPFQV